MDMRGLYRPVQSSALPPDEPVKVQFGGGRQGLDDIFERIMVSPGEQVEQQGGDFRVGEKLGIDMALFEIFGDGMVIGKVPVMHEGDVDGGKRVGAGRLLNASLGREAMGIHSWAHRSP